MNEWTLFTIRVAWVLERPSVSDRDSLSCTLFEVRMWVRIFFWLAPILCAENCENNPSFEKWLSPILTCPVSRESQRRRNPVEHQQEADVDNCLQRFPHSPIVFTLHVLVWLGVILVMNNLSIVFLSLRQRIGAIKFNEGDSGSIYWTIKLGVKFPPHFKSIFGDTYDQIWPCSVRITFIKFYRPNPLP